MCVKLLLFSALSRRVGALQLSIITIIIIIILFHLSVTNLLPFEHHAKEELSVRTVFGDIWRNQLWPWLEEECYITSYGRG